MAQYIRFPGPLLDCVRATKGIIRRLDDYGADRDKIYLMGMKICKLKKRYFKYFYRIWKVNCENDYKNCGLKTPRFSDTINNCVIIGNIIFSTQLFQFSETYAFELLYIKCICTELNVYVEICKY